MVKIRLTRMGNKHRPFYRIVVQKSASGRDSRAIETIGTYNPLTKPSTVTLQGDRAKHWLMNGAQPSETVAIILKREGVLDEFFAERPNAKKNYKFLDKRTAAMSQKSVIENAAPANEEEVPVPTPTPDQPAEDAPKEVPAEETPEEAPVEETPQEAPQKEGE